MRALIDVLLCGSHLRAEFGTDSYIDLIF